jgi:hypothetical protein
MHTEAVDLGTDARFQAVFPNDIAVDRCRIQVPVKATCPVGLYRPERNTLHIGPMSRERQIILKRWGFVAENSCRVIVAPMSKSHLN